LAKIAHFEFMIIIFAPNIRSGGGLVLLKSLMLHCLDKEKYFLILHEDMKNHMEVVPRNVKFFNGNVKSRLLAELYAWRLADQKDKIFCFHSLPSLIGFKKNCYVYFHNLNMLAPRILYRYDKWNFLRSSLEGVVLRALKYRINKVYCQSTLVVDILKKRVLLDSDQISVAPFSDLPTQQKCWRSDEIRSFNLIYPADAAPHKNHENLFAAACLLGSKIPNLKIFVTLEEKAYNYFKRKYPNEVILNKGPCKHDEVLELMTSCDALIFPSLTESLGLPLIEAHYLGVYIISPEMDYVRDICEPIETFDPKSPLSISRAVLRFFSVTEHSKQNIMSSRAFVVDVLDEL
jgi:glycosyltransferase involved in cell wall biosynthesis